MFVGVDVGGTNSDAVVLEDGKVVAWAKETTSEDVTTGVERVIRKVVDKAEEKKGKKKTSVKRICIGTTHFLNAVLQKRGLVKVSVIR